MDKVQKHNSFNTNTPSSESYRNYLGANFHRKITWRTHIDWVVTKTLRTFVQIYSLLKSEKLSIKNKMTFCKALIRSKMTYACPAWESAAVTHLMKLQRLQNKVLRVIGGLPRRTPTPYMQAELQIPYYMTL
jgi:hypothetical protein